MGKIVKFPKAYQGTAPKPVMLEPLECQCLEELMMACNNPQAARRLQEIIDRWQALLGRKSLAKLASKISVHRWDQGAYLK